MLKRFIALCLCLIFLSTGAICESINLDTELTLHMGENESSISFGLKSGEEDTIVISDLFPSYAISVPFLAGLNDLNEIGLFSVSPFSSHNLSSVVLSLLSMFSDSVVQGVYAGDLFDYAGSVQSASVKMEDLIDILSEKNIQAIDSSATLSFFIHLIGNIDVISLCPLDCSDMTVQFHSYDSAKYLTMNICSGSKTVLTVSSDFSDPNHLIAVLGFSENGKNYYRVLDASYMSEQELRIQTAVYSDDFQKGYRSVINKKPLLREDLHLEYLKDKNEYEFYSEIYPENGLRCMKMTGWISPGRIPFLYAELHSDKQDDGYISVSVSLNEKEITTDQLIHISVYDLGNDEIKKELLKEVSTGILTFGSELAEFLPVDYIIEIMNENLIQ